MRTVDAFKHIGNAIDTLRVLNHDSAAACTSPLDRDISILDPDTDAFRH